MLPCWRPGFCLALVLLSATAGAAGPAEPEQRLLPCGIMDPRGRTGYVSAAGGGLDALDLVTGHRLWTTAAARQPLFLVGDRLYARAEVDEHSFRVVGLDLTRQGRCFLQSEPLLFPDCVVVREGPHCTLETHWQRDRGAAVLDWEVRGRAGGARAVRGRCRIDLRTGQIEPQAENASAVPTAVAPPADLDRFALRWHGPVAGVYRAVVEESQPAGQRLSLLTWDPGTGQPLPAVPLLEGQRFLVRPSLDGRHLAFRAGTPSPDERAGTTQTWLVLDLLEGKTVARLPCESGTTSLAIAGPRAFLLVADPIRGSLNRPAVQPRRLQAIDLATGKVLWQHPVAEKEVVTALVGDRPLSPRPRPAPARP